MLIRPSPIELSPFWRSIELMKRDGKIEEYHFNVSDKSIVTVMLLQENQQKIGNSLLGNLLGTFQVIFDHPPPPFRIVMPLGQGQEMAGDAAICLAEATTMEEIRQDWTTIRERIVGPVSDNTKDWHAQIKSILEALEQFIDTQNPFNTDERSLDEHFRMTARGFRSHFGLDDQERLVNCTLLMISIISNKVRLFLCLQ